VLTGKIKSNEAKYPPALEMALAILLGNDTSGKDLIGYSSALINRYIISKIAVVIINQNYGLVKLKCLNLWKTQKAKKSHKIQISPVLIGVKNVVATGFALSTSIVNAGVLEVRPEREFLILTKYPMGGFVEISAVKFEN
jgi:hypothetical protein